MYPSFTGGSSRSVVFVSPLMGVRSVFAVPREAGGFVAWTVATSGNQHDDADAAMRLTAPATGSGPFLAMGPTTFACPAARCRALVHAAPDPRDDSLLALCESETMVRGANVRHIVREGTAPGCMVLDGATLPADSRMSALAVAR